MKITVFNLSVLKTFAAAWNSGIVTCLCLGQAGAPERLKPECIRAYALWHNVKYKLMWGKWYGDRELFRIANRTSGHFKGSSAFSRRMSAQSDSKALLDSAEETLVLSNDMDFSEDRRQIGFCFNLPPWIQISVPDASLTLTHYSFRAVIGWKHRRQRWCLSCWTNTCVDLANGFRILKLKPQAFVSTHSWSPIYM